MSPKLNLISNQRRLVPWGNAQYVKPKKTIICQHGEDECYLNTIHACAISIWPDPRKHFNFIYCIENQGLPIKDNQHSDGMEAVWKACSARSGMDQKLIKDCYDSGYGRKKYEDFITYVCNAYKDKDLVRACLSNSLKVTEEKFSRSPVCYVEIRSQIQQRLHCCSGGT
ncbi:hypothetical protein V6Z12_D04G161400 [Gossypium hirsutum]